MYYAPLVLVSLALPVFPSSSTATFSTGPNSKVSQYQLAYIVFSVVLIGGTTAKYYGEAPWSRFWLFLYNRLPNCSIAFFVIPMSRPIVLAMMISKPCESSYWPFMSKPIRRSLMWYAVECLIAWHGSMPVLWYQRSAFSPDHIEQDARDKCS